MLELAAARADRATRAGSTVDEAMIRRPKLAGPSTTVGVARAALLNPHVHAVLVVENGRLMAVVERDDLEGVPAERPVGAVRAVGRLEGRVVLSLDPPIHDG